MQIMENAFEKIRFVNNKVGLGMISESGQSNKLRIVTHFKRNGHALVMY
jgi:hypothetical protein